MAISGITIRPLIQFEELEATEDIQRFVWNDPSVVIYRNTLVNLVRNGGYVLGALDGDKLVGFVLSYLGTDAIDSDRPAMANLKMVSQRMAILPEYRDRGIGYELKLAQRNIAVKQGIRLITWTFDPLQTRNAHLNIRKLGAVVRQYWRDYYGTTPSPQVVLGSSDRMLVEWWVTGNRVEQRLNGKRSALTLSHYTDTAAIVNPSLSYNDLYPKPGLKLNMPQGMVVLVEIPGNYNAMVENDPTLAKAWRQHSREILEQTMAAGYTVTDFVRGVYEDRERNFYTLTVVDVPVGGFSFN
jgi:predicted GNAT superfamily acetyltransferase